MFSIVEKPRVTKIFRKLRKKNPKAMEIIAKKLEEIAENPLRFKNLRSPLNYMKRVHIDDHFVLAFSVDTSSETVFLEDYDHHDRIYLNTRFS
ncbi:hypothetical protein KY359_03940 [Candidatus Woesearchaeota archaeon]|nr:hypothetical protein [Candidatus Woesearchaeota archaeon]